MDSELLPVLFNPAYSSWSVGSEMMLAKARYYAAYGPFWPQAESMLNQYNIIGDPALVLQFPQNTLQVRLNSYTAVTGQNVTGAVSGGPAGGKGIAQLTNIGGDVIGQTNFTVGSSGAATFSIPYSGGLSGLSHVKVYAYNGSSQDAGSVDLTTAASFAQISNIGITSNGSTFRITVHGLASSTTSAIKSVAFDGNVYRAGSTPVGAPVMSLDFPLSGTATNEYSAGVSISADSLKSGESITGRLRALLSSGDTVSSEPVTYVVPGAADLSAYPQSGVVNVNPSIKVVADSLLRLQALVYDWNSVAAKNVRVDFYDSSRGIGPLLGSTRVSFDSTSQERVEIPVTLSPGAHDIFMYVVFDSLTDGYDLAPANDYAHNKVNVDYAVANRSGVVTVNSIATLSGAYPGEIFKVDTTTPSLFSQPLMSVARDTGRKAYFCTFAKTASSKSGSYRISLTMVNADSATVANEGGLRIYMYDPRTRTLNLAGGSFGGGAVSANVNQLGTFTAAYSSDRTPPHVSLSVGDQFFTNGDFVPPDPRFSILINDEDGVDLQSGSVNVQIDGQQVDPSLVTVPDTVTNPTSVTATVQVPLKDGSHTIQITAKDANGNVSNPVSASFVVRSDFSLRVYGAYPDPFANQTFIAFEVTSGQPIDAVSLKIYTVAGRLVKTMQYPSNNPMETIGLLQGGTGSPTSVGYHEAWWDGTDNYGNQVANGVYFYKVEVSSGGKTRVYIGKMARLR